MLVYLDDSYYDLILIATQLRALINPAERISSLGILGKPFQISK